MRRNKIIVTGGAGFIGSYLVDKLILLGHQVTVYDNLSTGKKAYLNPKAHFFKTDLSKPVKLVPADYIFHLAALPRIERSFDHPLATHHANTTATLNLLNQAQKLKVKRFIFTSSSSVYGKIDKKDLPVKETYPPRPESPYAAQKLISETYCRLFNRDQGIDTIILRYFNVYGPRQPTTGAYKLVIPIFLEQNKKHQPLTVFGDGKQSRDFTYVSDAVEATIKALEVRKKLNAEIINIGTGKPVTILQLAKQVGGKTKFIQPNPRASWEEPFKYADISKAKRLLNWKPRIFIQNGLKKLLSDKKLENTALPS